MKIQEFIDAITPENLEKYTDYSDLARDLGIECNYVSGEDVPRLTSAWIKRWLCTDTYVGTEVIFFDGNPFAIKHKPARRSSAKFMYFSENDSTNDVLKYLLTHVYSLNDNLTFVSVEDQFPW